jgi:hypothetical protein
MILKFESYQTAWVKLVFATGPDKASMAGHITTLFGCDANVAQHRASEFGEKALDEIEPCVKVKSWPADRSATLVAPMVGSCSNPTADIVKMTVRVAQALERGRLPDWSRTGGFARSDTHLTTIPTP